MLSTAVTKNNSGRYNLLLTITSSLNVEKSFLNISFQLINHVFKTCVFSSFHKKICIYCHPHIANQPSISTAGPSVLWEGQRCAVDQLAILCKTKKTCSNYGIQWLFNGLHNPSISYILLKSYSLKTRCSFTRVLKNSSIFTKNFMQWISNMMVGLTLILNVSSLGIFFYVKMLVSTVVCVDVLTRTLQ